ncbi:MAG: AAA family ATPase [Candidatus Paceibacterota bacterium]|jgi:DNA repair exonuclease SbcCD ATPase subunit
MNDLFDEEIAIKEISNLPINKVVIQNYRNIDYKEYVLNGANLLLEGKNGIGKTNVLEAIFWALSGVLFNGVSLSDKQELKPYESANDIVTSVKLEFAYNSFTFERKLEEKWSKDGETKKGTETTLLVNGAASKDQDSAINLLYDYLGLGEMKSKLNKIPSLSKINIFELFYNASSLKSMDYKEIRAIVTDMVGEVDYKEVINENQLKYTPLVLPLKNHGLDLQALKTDTRSKIFDKKTGLEKQVEELETTIKAFDTEGKKVVDADELQNAKTQIENIDTEIAKLEKQKSTSSSDLFSQYTNEINAKQNEIYARQDVLRTEHEKEIKRLQDTSIELEIQSKQTSLLNKQKERVELTSKINDKSNEKTRIESSITNKKYELDSKKEFKNSLLEQWKKLKNPQSVETYTCPKCLKPFSLSETKEYQENLKPRFAEIMKNGEETNQKIKGLEEGIETLKIDTEVLGDFILELQTERNQLDISIKALQDDIKSLQEKSLQQKAKLPILDFLTDTIILSIKEQINALVAKRTTVTTDNQKHFETIESQIKELKLKKEPFTDIINLESTARSYQQNAELSRRKLATVNADLQTQREIEILVKELEKEMYQRLDQKVESVFGENIKFKLWKLNVSNGEYDTRLCEVYVRDIQNRFINIKTINTGMFPIRAIEIISRIKKHYNIKKSFIFIDELGSLDSTHKELIKAFGEQVFATQVAENKTVKEILF